MLVLVLSCPLPYLSVQDAQNMEWSHTKKEMSIFSSQPRNSSYIHIPCNFRNMLALSWELSPSFQLCSENSHCYAAVSLRPTSCQFAFPENITHSSGWLCQAANNCLSLKFLKLLFGLYQQTTPAACTLLLPPKPSRKENTRDFYYFKIGQLTQWLGQEFSVLILRVAFFILLSLCHSWQWSHTIDSVRDLHVCSLLSTPQSGLNPQSPEPPPPLSPGT